MVEKAKHAGYAEQKGIAYLVVTLIAFILGMAFSQCENERQEGRSRVDWPSPKQMTEPQNPRKL